MNVNKTVFITGAAGYVGTMLVREFAKRDDVALIIGLDKEPIPDLIANEPKLEYLQTNAADEDWEAEVASRNPDIVIHTAWQIRELYGDRPTTWRWNVEGTERVAGFALRTPSISRFIDFSTVASYGAFADNAMDHFYTEDEPFRQSEYLYAEEKRIAEERVQQLWDTKQRSDISFSILRPAAITGPRGRYQRIRFGLQSALSGSLKDEPSFAYRVISLLVSRIPATPKWLRQFIHEDDVVGIVERLAFGPEVPGYEVFNICPPDSVVLAQDMADAVGKRVLPIAPWMMRIGNFFAWHLSRGKVPTGPGAWRGYSYPIAVDGSKVTRVLGYTYKHQGLDAFRYTDGTYEEFVPEAARKHAA